MFREAESRGGRIILPLLVVLPLGLNLLVTFLRVEPAWPLTPWEPALLAEGWRLAHGLPLYETSTQGHATHLYGPLFTVLLAGLQSLFGFNYPAIRLVFVFLGVVTSFCLAAMVSPEIRSWRFLLAVVLLLSCNLQTGLSFAVSWADMPALLCAILGLFALLQRGKEIGWVRGLLGGGLLVIAFLFKQTAALAGLILVALWIFSPELRRRGGFWLWLPLVMTWATVLSLAVLAPAVFHQIVRVPSSIEIVGGRWWEGMAYMLRGHPLFWVCVGLAIAGFADVRKVENLSAWIYAGVGVVLVSAWTYAKAGGYYNSLIPGVLFLSLFCISMFDAIPQSQIKAWSGLAKISLAVAFVVTTMAGALEALRLMGMRHGDGYYARAIGVARELGGSVICPEDPSIPLLGKGTPGKSLYFELDFASLGGGWPTEPPARIQADLQAADWLIRIQGSYPTVLATESLGQSGWVQVGIPGFDQSVYSFWRKTKPGEPGAVPAPTRP